MHLRNVIALCLLGWLPASLSADEATLSDGRHVEGTLLFEQGRLRFAPRDAVLSVAGTSVKTVRFGSGAVTPLSQATSFRLGLADDQSITGNILDFSDTKILLRTSWSERVTLPRQAVRSLMHATHRLTVFADDFENGLGSWKTKGKPQLSDRQQRSGRQSLRFSRPDQAVEVSLPEALPAGRIVFDYFHSETSNGLRCVLELELGATGESRTVRMALPSKNESLQVTGGDLTGQAETLQTSAGWHHWECRFHDQYLLLGVDGHLLWSSNKGKLQLPLRKLRLICEGKETEGAELFVDDFQLSRPLPERKPAFVSGENAVALLASGDELFGQTVRVDTHVVEFAGKFGARSLPWNKLQAIWFPTSPASPQVSEGEHVRLFLRTGVGPQHDELDGVLRAFDAKQLTLRHALLGDLLLPRNQVERLNRNFHGQRIEVDNGCHVLGDPTRPVPGFPPAEGLELKRVFQLTEVPAEATLILTLLASPPRLRSWTTLLVNEVATDDVSQRIELVDGSTRRWRLTIPGKMLRKGENSVEWRQSAKPGVFSVLQGIVVEVQR